MPNINLETDEIIDLVKDMDDAIKWLENLQNALTNERYLELSGNIGRIEEIQKKFSALRDYLDKFTPSSDI